MTDNYDLDPQEHGAHAEDEHAHEVKAEAWPDDQPPVDDFSDAGTEETATSSEETAAPQEGGADSEPRRSSVLLPIIAGVGGLLCLGAVLYWQFGRPSSSPPAVPPPPPLQMAVAPPRSPASPPPVASTPEVAPKTSLNIAGNPSAAIPSAPPPGSAGPLSLGNVPPIESAGASPAAAPAPAAPPPITSAAEIDSRLNNLSARVDELKKGLDQTTQQLAQLNAALASPSAPGNAATEDRLNKIEQQLGQLQHAAPVISSPPVLEAPEAAAPSETPTPPAPKPAEHKSSRHQKTGTSTASHKRAAHMAKVKSTSWVLRAATPDEAWVAEDEATSELRHIKVGDKLSGIGRVVAIRQTGDAWVVEGSAGSIR